MSRKKHVLLFGGRREVLDMLVPNLPLDSSQFVNMKYDTPFEQNHGVVPRKGVAGRIVLRSLALFSIMVSTRSSGSSGGRDGKGAVICS